MRLLVPAVYRQAMTKTDARLSVARVFCFSEMRELAARAGWKVGNLPHCR
jgi:hypothetical protein